MKNWLLLKNNFVNKKFITSVQIEIEKDKSSKIQDYVVKIYETTANGVIFTNYEEKVKKLTDAKKIIKELNADLDFILDPKNMFCLNPDFVASVKDMSDLEIALNLPYLNEGGYVLIRKIEFNRKEDKEKFLVNLKNKLNEE